MTQIPAPAKFERSPMTDTTRRMHRRIAALPLVLLASGCATAAESPAREYVADSIVAFEMDSATVAIRHLAADPRGDVWAIGTTSPFGQHYAPDGRLVRRFGGQGAGPGELRTPWIVLPTGDPARPVDVYDLGQRVLVSYDSGFREVARRPIESRGFVVPQYQANTFGQMRWLAPSGDGYLLFDQPEGVLATRSITGSVLLRLDSIGVVVDTLLDLRDAGPPVTVSSRPLEFVDVPLVAACPAGGALLLDPRESVLHRFDRDHFAVTRDTLRLSVRVLTDDDIRPWLAMMFDDASRGGIAPADSATRDEEIRRFLREDRDWFGERTPAATGLLCDPDGRAWLQEFSTADDPTGRGRRWRVFDGSRHTATVVLPSRIRPFVIVPNGILGVHSDDLDLQRVVRIVLPSF